MTDRDHGRTDDDQADDRTQADRPPAYHGPIDGPIRKCDVCWRVRIHRRHAAMCDSCYQAVIRFASSKPTELDATERALRITIRRIECAREVGSVDPTAAVRSTQFSG